MLVWVHQHLLLGDELGSLELPEIEVGFSQRKDGLI